MTRDDVKELLPIMTAFTEGKDLEVFTEHRKQTRKGNLSKM